MCIYDKTRHRSLRDRSYPPHKIPLLEEVTMFRRYAAILTLAFATFALAACTSPTAPTSDVCTITAGSGTC